MQKAFSRIKKGVEISSITDELSEGGIDRSFIKEFEIDIINTAKPFMETGFLREANEEEFKNSVDYIFYNTLLHRISGKELYKNSPYDKEQTTHLCKFINTINNYIIFDRYSKGLFLQKVNNLFAIKKRKAEMLWDLFEEHRTELNIICIMDRLRRLEKTVDNIYEIFDSIVYDIEESEPDLITALFELMLTIIKMCRGDNVDRAEPLPISPEMRVEVQKLDKTLEEYHFLRVLIDHIDVYEKEGASKNHTQHIVIYYHFVGVLDLPDRQEYYKADTRKGVEVEYIPKAKTA